jgi:hypothetical protein
MFANCLSKRAVHRAFNSILLALDALGREPDQWEQEALVDALCSMACGRYLDAATRIVDVRLSLLKRPASCATEGKSAVSKEMMRRGLDHIQVHHSTAAPCVKAV